MPESRTIEALRGGIKTWIHIADEQILLETESKERAKKLSNEMEQVITHLPTKICPLCKGTMLDYASLESFAERLRSKQVYLFQGEKFGWQCLNCTLFPTN